jgi:hypothetical protein
MEKAIGGRFRLVPTIPKTAEDDDENENDSEMTLNTYKPWAKLSWPCGPKTTI